MPAVKMQIYQRDEIKLDIEKRSECRKGPVGRLRRNGDRLPGVVYGNDQDSTPFKVETLLLERALSQGGQNAVFVLQQNGTEVREKAVVREIQYHKVTGDILHVDMLRIDPQEHLRVEVPITAAGIPVGVHVGGGATQHSLQIVEMTCLASELPSRVEIDISDLEIGESIHVSDLIELDDRITTDPSITIVTVLSPRLTVDEEIAAAEAAEAAEAEELMEGEELAEGETSSAEASSSENDGDDDGGGNDNS